MNYSNQSHSSSSSSYQRISIYCIASCIIFGLYQAVVFTKRESQTLLFTPPVMSGINIDIKLKENGVDRNRFFQQESKPSVLRNIHQSQNTYKIEDKNRINLNIENDVKLESEIYNEDENKAEDLKIQNRNDLTDKNINQDKFLTTYPYPKNNKILLVTAGVQPVVPNGGISAMFTRYANLLKEENNITLLMPYKNSRSAEGQKFWAKSGIPFYFVNVDKKNYGTNAMKRSYSIMNFILNFKENFDIIIFHDYMGIATHTIQMKRTGLALQKSKLVVTCHSSSRYSNLMNRRKATVNALVIYGMEDYSRTYADLTIFPANFFHDLMQEESEMPDKFQNVQIIPNFIHGIEGPPKSTSARTLLHTKKLAYFGRVDKLKGIEFILDTLKALPEGTIDEFLIFGDINSDQMQNLVMKNKEIIERTSKIKVTIKSSRPTKEAMAFLRENNFVVLLASYFESYSCALQELVLYRIPVIFSDAGGSREVVSEHFSMYEIEDQNALISIIKKGVRDGFKYLTLAHDNNEVTKRFISSVSKPLLSVKPLPFKDCGDVTVGIITRGRKDMVIDLVTRLYEKQTCKNFNILIVNNDNMEYDFEYKVNQLVRDNVQVSKARNTIINNTKTKYLVLFDDDDIPLEDMLYNLKATQLNNNAVLTSGPCNNILGGKFEKVSLASGFTNLGAGLLRHVTGKATVMLDTKFMKSIGGVYEERNIEKNSPFVDWTMYSKVALNHGKISMYPLPLYNYTKKSKSSLYYTASEMKRFWGFQKNTRIYCKHLNLPMSMCDALGTFNSK